MRWFLISAVVLLIIWLLRVKGYKLIAYLMGDTVTLQAIEDQKLSDYPGCQQGLMGCRAFCNCTSAMTPSLTWVNARASQLKLQTGCLHIYTKDFRSSMFPEF